MQSRATQILEAFTGGYNCCQSVLVTYGEIYGLERETALKLASGMGSGVGNTGKLCGFVNASCLLLGLKHGTDAPDSKLNVQPICREFCDDFLAKYGSVNCTDIIKRLRAMKAADSAKEGGGKICGECGQWIAELLETKYDILNP